jgi:SAM-dependent methyltransferase
VYLRLALGTPRDQGPEGASGSLSTRNLPNRSAQHLSPGSPHYRAFVGPPDEYDTVGASQFRLLTTLGLREQHKLLDFGCGSLRAGRLLIPYLGEGKYVGLDPERWLIEDAIAREIGENMVVLKRPSFHHFDDFAADRCGTEFDYILAHSILSHTGKDLFRQALASFQRALSPTGLALITVLHAEPGQDADVDGGGWIYPECVRYSPAALHELFREAGLAGRLIPWRHPRQVWYVLAPGEEALPPAHFDPHLSGITIDNFSHVDAAPGPEADAPANYSLGTTVELNEIGAAAYLHRGFGPPESWGRWTDGRRAMLVIRPREPTRSMLLELWTASAFVGDGDSCAFTISLNGLLPRRFRVGTKSALVAIPVGQVADDDPLSCVSIQIEIAHPKTPDQHPRNDVRALGLALARFRLSAVPADPHAQMAEDRIPRAIER